jgi:hypothetical protein
MSRKSIPLRHSTYKLYGEHQNRQKSRRDDKLNNKFRKQIVMQEAKEEAREESKEEQAKEEQAREEEAREEEARVQLTYMITEIYSIYYAEYQITGDTKDIFDNRINNFTSITINYFNQFKEQYPNLTPKEFIVALIYYYSVYNKTTSEYPVNSKDMCLLYFPELILTEQEIIEKLKIKRSELIFHGYMSYQLPTELKIYKKELLEIDNPEFIKFHENIDKCLLKFTLLDIDFHSNIQKFGGQKKRRKSIQRKKIRKIRKSRKYKL